MKMLTSSGGRRKGPCARVLSNAAMLLLLTGALAVGACGRSPETIDNRNPNLTHGNIEDPGTRAVDNQGEAGQMQ